MKIAVIGSGIAGNACAWGLMPDHQVVLFEKDDRLGGHANTATIEYDGRQISVDTGFIVFNEYNYPNLTALLDHIDVETAKTVMTFSVSLDDGAFEWRGNEVKGIFAQKRNLFSPGFLYMLQDILRFNRQARKDLNSGALCGISMGDYLSRKRYSGRLRDDYLIPMVSAIWSTPPSKMMEYPAESLVRFMDNHRLMQLRRPKWRTVQGGSIAYIQKLFETRKVDTRLNSKVVSVRRQKNNALVTLSDGSAEEFDHVVFAGHSDQSRDIIQDASPLEDEILRNIPYAEHEVILHRDPNLMPNKRDAWASWNYMGKRNSANEQTVSVTYWMNRLQHITDECPLFVSLNPHKQPAEDLIFKRYKYAHPQFSSKALEMQDKLPEIQGNDRYSFCGAWTRYGFHEDGLSSGMAVAERLGAVYPWKRSASDVNKTENPSSFHLAAE